MRRGLCDGLCVCDEGVGNEESEAFTRRDETRRSVRGHLARFCCPNGRDNDQTRRGDEALTPQGQESYCYSYAWRRRRTKGGPLQRRRTSIQSLSPCMSPSPIAYKQRCTVKSSRRVLARLGSQHRVTDLHHTLIHPPCAILFLAFSHPTSQTDRIPLD
jgi:hypothetical protein